MNEPCRPAFAHRPVFAAVAAFLLSLCLIALPGCQSTDSGAASDQTIAQQADPSLAADDIPAYSGKPYTEIDGNTPDFTADELATGSFEDYSPLDDLGRCGSASALVGTETMPTKKRGDISKVHPTGWHSSLYGIVDGESLYNRCHLLGYALTAENANERNLITGTRYLNVDGMLPFENKIANYVHDTGNHVLYRVTPLFVGDELVARGVHMEAESVEDDGAGVSFNVYCYNVQPGIVIDYKTGDNWLKGDPGHPDDPNAEATEGYNAANGSAEDTTQNDDAQADDAQHDYVLNTSSHKFHKPDCPAVDDIKASNKADFQGTREEAIAQGYQPCGICEP